MVHSVSMKVGGGAGKTVRSLENACHSRYANSIGHYFDVIVSADSVNAMSAHVSGMPTHG